LCSTCLALVALVGDCKINLEKISSNLEKISSLSLLPYHSRSSAGIRIIGGLVAFVAAVLKYGC
jgi:hypothetical protein